MTLLNRRGAQTVFKAESHYNDFFHAGGYIQLVILEGFYDRTFSTHLFRIIGMGHVGHVMYIMT